MWRNTEVVEFVAWLPKPSMIMALLFWPGGRVLKVKMVSALAPRPKNTPTAARATGLRFFSRFRFMILQIFRQYACCPLPFAFAIAGKSRDARMAMIAITTNSSINVNAGSRTGQISGDNRARDRSFPGSHMFCTDDDSLPVTCLATIARPGDRKSHGGRPTVTRACGPGLGFRARGWSRGEPSVQGASKSKRRLFRPTRNRTSARTG